MIEFDDTRVIGKFQRTHALKGELNAMIDLEDDFLTDYPLLVEIDGLLVPFYAESVRPKGSASSIVKLEGVDSGDEAKAFVNKEIRARVSDLRDYLGDDFEDTGDIVGYTLIGKDLGPIGEITHIDDTTENVLLSVDTPDGETVYIPLVEELVHEVDDVAHTVLMEIPDGLLDINRSGAVDDDYDGEME